MPTTPNARDGERERVELELLLEGIHRLRGHDLRSWARPSLVRGIRRFAQAERLATLKVLGTAADGLKRFMAP